ncbi:MAG: SCO family protein [Kaistella sp.]
MKYLIRLLFLMVTLFSCKENTEQANLKKENAGSSIFLLDSKWQNQNGEELYLRDLKGKNLVFVMIFTSCRTACPILVADMKKIHAKIEKNKLEDTSLVLISIDPTNDTPEVLKKFAAERNMDNSSWIFLRSDEDATREFANVLAVKYKKISPVEFSHSNIISVFDRNGELVSQEEGSGINSDAVAKTVNQLK